MVEVCQPTMTINLQFISVIGQIDFARNICGKRPAPAVFFGSVFPPGGRAGIL